MTSDCVYILDDDPSVRESLAYFLTATGFAGRQFATAAAFLAEADGLAPGCLLLDIRMPEIDGFDVLERLATRRTVLPVVVMTGHGDVDTAVRAMKLGAHDFVEKPFEENMILGVLARVFETLDGTVRDMERQRDVAARLGRLTPREADVLRGLLAGRPNKLIAYDLGISIRTVEMHRSGMMEALGIRTFVGALRLAIEGGMAMPSAPADMFVGPA